MRGRATLAAIADPAPRGAIGEPILNTLIMLRNDASYHDNDPFLAFEDASTNGRCGPQATISSPFFCTRCSSLSAVPVGRFWPISHFCTVETLVFKRAAKTAWLTFEVCRMRLIWAGRSGGAGARLRWSNSRMVT